MRGRPPKTRNKILEYLKCHDCARLTEIERAHSEMSRPHVRMVLSSLVKRGEIERVGDAMYKYKGA